MIKGLFGYFHFLFWNSFEILDRNEADLEKAASGGSGACGHFVGNHGILRTFSVKYPVLLAEDQGRRVEDGELKLDKRDLRNQDR